VLSTRGPERPPFVISDQEDADFDVQAQAAIGVTIPLVSLDTWQGGGITLTGMAGVFSRFRIEYPSRDDLGQDWIVGGGIEAAWDEWSTRIRISHRSSHLGDEFVEQTGADRIEFGGEALDGLVGYTFPGIARVYGGGAWIFRSYTDKQVPVMLELGRRDRLLLQLGADGEWQPWDSSPIGLVAGIDWQTAERTDWKSALSAGAGFNVNANGRTLGLILRFFDGASPLGEFFLSPEQFWSFELLAEF